MSLQTLYLMPTLNCNCRCTYCYIPEPYRQQKQTANLIPVVKKFLSEANPNPQLRFIGGEPTLEMNQIIQLIQYFSSHTDNGLIVINTNATILSKDSLQSLRTLKDSIVFIVSLDGLEETHNSRRKLLSNENAFLKTINGITTLQSLGFHIICNMVIDPDNENEPKALFPFLKQEFSMNSISVSLNSNFTKNFSPEKKTKLLKKIYLTAEKNNILISGHHRLLLGKRIPELSCQAGKKTVLITPNQNVWACQRFIGNHMAKQWSTTEPLQNSVDNTPVLNCCYTAENELIGDLLYNFYQTTLPHYLTVNHLDKTLFGVIT